MLTNSDSYHDIRPYNDSEVPAAIERLINDQAFIDAIVSHRFERSPKWLSSLLGPFVKILLRIKWRKFKSVAHIQDEVGRFMETLLQRTSDGVTVKGLDKLDPTKAYIFISNHRDIAMDPALVNFALHSAGHNTALIAFGDNLLKKPSATELMKLNKGFVVKRSAKKPRELLKALTQLSNFIKDALQSNQSVWIAQREGRAKDGMDFTDPAILKMFYMAGKQQKLEFADYMKSLNIVPVAIAYENDPCDIAKANELYQVNHHGQYNKTEFEDIDSIVKGIVGHKGRLTVTFGSVIDDDFTTPAELASQIDAQIHRNYQLYPINYLAANQQHGEITAECRARLDDKLSQLPAEAHPYLLANYANPVNNAR
ncbi:lysophospholipid acyltransferase family protein [Alteromonas gilva]|uniref:1-acyl-sn-glycerol-3-phosphate acyltransferase n=1 Tax=Alteromonas gilva TaxID=2987522 RepID=A0ABT5L4P7_9ALTE|nr:1-acyl-sn-glycerol-3-phosphate acyltransferase [Alteromonas gilva]MDC8832017.1 1-acyl-sn-glycerol-3-phosphate acyltransferase [Alteromonas gilva]